MATLVWRDILEETRVGAKEKVLLAPVGEVALCWRLVVTASESEMLERRREKIGRRKAKEDSLTDGEDKGREVFISCSVLVTRIMRVFREEEHQTEEMSL